HRRRQTAVRLDRRPRRRGRAALLPDRAHPRTPGTAALASRLRARQATRRTTRRTFGNQAGSVSERRTDGMDELLTVDEVAARRRVSRWTVYRLIKERHLTSVKVGKCRRIAPESVTVYIAGLVEEAA